MGVGESYGAVDAELPKGKPQVRESGVGHPFGRKALGRREGESSTLDLLRTAVNQALCSSLSDLKSSQPPQSHQFRPSIPRCPPAGAPGTRRQAARNAPGVLQPGPNKSAEGKEGPRGFPPRKPSKYDSHTPGSGKMTQR